MSLQKEIVHGKIRLVYIFTRSNLIYVKMFVEWELQYGRCSVIHNYIHLHCYISFHFIYVCSWIMPLSIKFTKLIVALSPYLTQLSALAAQEILIDFFSPEPVNDPSRRTRFRYIQSGLIQVFRKVQIKAKLMSADILYTHIQSLSQNRELFDKKYSTRGAEADDVNLYWTSSCLVW